MHNPFEAPEAQPFEAELHPRAETVGHLDVGRCLTEAWDATWDVFPLWLGVAAVGTVLALAAAITLVGYVLVLPVLAWGFVLFLLNGLERRATFSDLFAGFSRYGDALGAFLGVGFFHALSFAPGLVVEVVGLALGETTVAAIGWGGAVAAFLTVTLRLSFAPFYAVDQGVPALEALRRSWHATADQKLAVIGLGALSAVVASLGILALGVGLVPSTMVAYFMWAAAYRQLAGRAP